MSHEEKQAIQHILAGYREAKAAVALLDVRAAYLRGRVDLLMEIQAQLVTEEDATPPAADSSETDA